MPDEQQLHRPGREAEFRLTHRRISQRFVHCAVAPPSTEMAWPFTKDEASEQSQTTASAISDASANRRIGETSVSAFSNFGFSAMRSSIMAVRTVPGQTALTRMPLRPYSTAAAFVRPTTPCFDAT